MLPTIPVPPKNKTKQYIHKAKETNFKILFMQVMGWKFMNTVGILCINFNAEFH